MASVFAYTLLMYLACLVDSGIAHRDKRHVAYGCFTCAHTHIQPQNRELEEAVSDYGGAHSCSIGNFSQPVMASQECTIHACAVIDVGIEITLSDDTPGVVELTVRQCFEQFDMVLTPVGKCSDVNNLPDYVRDVMLNSLQSPFFRRAIESRIRYFYICICNTYEHDLGEIIDGSTVHGLCNGQNIEEIVVNNRKAREIGIVGSGGDTATCGGCLLQAIIVIFTVITVDGTYI